MVLDLLLVREALVLIASAAGAYTDYKTGFIYDKITYPLIALGVLLNLVEQNWIDIGLGIAVFAVGYAFYWFGKIGGGDVKLFAGIALTIPFTNHYPFILLVLFAAALLSVLLVSLQYVIAYARKGIDWKENMKGIQRAMLFAILFIVYFYMLLQQGMISSTGVIALGIPLLFGLAFFALEKGIRKEFFLKQVKLSELEEDELAAKEFMDAELVQKVGLKEKGILDAASVKKLRELNVQTVPVYRGLPKFGPYILGGVIIALVVPNYLQLLFLLA